MLTVLVQVVGDYVLVRAAVGGADSYIKLAGADLTLEDGISRGTAFRIATPHPVRKLSQL